MDMLLEPWKPGAVMAKPETAPVETMVVTEPVILDAVTNSIAAAADLRAVARDIREGRLSTTPKLNGLPDAFTSFMARVEAAAEKLMEKMNGTATATETAVDKFAGEVDKIAAQAKAIDDAANQLTNGGPPILGNS